MEGSIQKNKSVLKTCNFQSCLYNVKKVNAVNTKPLNPNYRLKEQEYVCMTIVPCHKNIKDILDLKNKDFVCIFYKLVTSVTSQTKLSNLWLKTQYVRTSCIYVLFKAGIERGT